MQQDRDLLTARDSIQQMRKPFPGFANIHRLHGETLKPVVYIFGVHNLRGLCNLAPEGNRRNAQLLDLSAEQQIVEEPVLVIEAGLSA